MCDSERVKLCLNAFLKPYVVVVIQIILEVSIISMQLYASHETLIVSMQLIDEIFGAISALYLVLSVGALFVFSCTVLYKNYKIIGAVQAVIMISNGLIFLITVVKTQNSRECAQVEELSMGEKHCQPFALRIAVGCLAILDGVMYFARKPIVHRFLTRNEGLEAFENSNAMNEALKRNSREFMMDDDPTETDEYSRYGQHCPDFIVKVPISVPTEFQTPQSELPKPTSSIANHAKTNAPGPTHQSATNTLSRSPIGMSEIVRVSSPQNTFYMNQEYFLPAISNNAAKASTSADDLTRFPKKAEFQNTDVINAFA